MRLTPSSLARGRVPSLLLRGALLLLPALLAAGVPTSFAQAQDASAAAPAVPTGAGSPKPEDLLGNVTVEAGASRVLPQVAILPSLASDAEDLTLRSVVRRDLELCGEFEVLPDSAAPEGLYLPDSPIDASAWAGKGVEALVKVSGRHLPDGDAELRAQALLLTGTGAKGTSPAFERVRKVKASELRVESHRLADAVIGALTGQDGSFASHLTFSSGKGNNRRVYTIDADGNGARAVSPTDRVAIASAFGPGEQLFYVASRNHDEFAVYRAEGDPQPLAQPVRGSVYGLAWSRDRKTVAAAIAHGGTIRIYSGPDLAHASATSSQTMALDPAFSPSGRLGYMAETKNGTRILVDGAPASPDGLFASSPTFCNHPEGVRLVYAVTLGDQSDLVAAGERGGNMLRLTQSQGSNVAPACSPDGRLVAFFSTRKGGEGPGLYVMRIDGGHPRKVSQLLGDSLRWDPFPPAAPAP